MKIQFVPVGNSQETRIPKPLLEKSGLNGEVDISVEAGTLVIRTAHRPRADWEQTFSAMSRSGDNILSDGDALSLSTWDRHEWQLS